jgi:hypothetical protein
MNFKKINNLCGWAVFAIAYLVYLLTMERTVSFWDCGEFLSTAYGLEVGHSPGAPLFMLLGRLFGMFAGPLHRALFINSLSALTSGLTILFLFWTITHFAKKLLTKPEEELTAGKLIAIMGAGIVGALAYTFSDTFWFSAVEAEVYATSSFFTAIVFWAILKWEHTADEPHADRWLVLISYLMGLSIGVHLLNLLTIPAIAMVYYFRKSKPTLSGSVIAFIIGCVLLGAFQVGLIQGIPILASKFELLFVNGFGMPLDSGAIFFILLLAALVVLGIVVAKKRALKNLQMGILCFVFAMIGYSSYVCIIIRSRADVPIDMTNPDDVLSLLSYLQREQYGAQPIVTGPDYNSKADGESTPKTVYSERTVDGKTRYDSIGSRSADRTYPSDQKRFFPRLYDAGHADFYQRYLGIEANDNPTTADNYAFFFKYQTNWMWWRYFMWNYAGRENDFAGTSYGEPQNGNWISGIKPIDKMMGRGDLDQMPDYMKNNRARNQFYFLPLILGIMGLVYQFKRNKRDGTIIALLFFFTGLAIVIYLNNTPQQPRERDYAYAGATYAFAIWIGLGVLMVADLMRRVLKNGNAAPIAATLLTVLLVPVLMACQDWDDHDRSQKSLARSTAYNVLSSCDSNAILFTVGDNDTYPLWYMQEVEGYRTDVRIINLSLLGIDWYIDQLNYKINNADAVPMIWQPKDYQADNMNVVISKPLASIPSDKFVNLEEVLKYSTSDNPSYRFQYGNESYGTFPTQNLFVKVDKAQAIKNGLVSASDSARISDISFTLKKDQLYKPDLGILNIIAGVARDGWKRPIYFSAGFPGGSDFQNMDEYIRMEGLVNKLVPIRTVNSSPEVGAPQAVNENKTLDLYLNKFLWGGTDKKNIYFDEKNKAMLMSYRFSGTKVAEALIRDNRKEDAIKLLDKITNNITYESYQYDQAMWGVASAYYAAGAKDKGAKIAEVIVGDAQKMVNYLTNVDNEKERQLGIDVEGRQLLGSIQVMIQAAQQNGDTANAEKWMQALMSCSQKLNIPLK